MQFGEELSTGKIVLAVAASRDRLVELEQLIAVVGCTRAVVADIDDALKRLNTLGTPSAVLIDAADLAEAHFLSLHALITCCKAERLRTIVMLTTDQLDDVGAMLIGDDATLLCDAPSSEVIGALALAVADPSLTVRDSSNEAARRRRIEEEVARFAATLTRIVDREDAPAVESKSASPFIADRMVGPEDREADIDPREVRRAIRTRRIRDDVFAQPGLFEDPAWDMILDLFAAELERRRVSVSSLCIAAAVAPTTALRWIGKLIDAELLERQPDAFDRRRAFISLTARASMAMRSYLAAAHRAGLAIA